MRIWYYQNPLRESLSTSYTNICNHMFQLVFDATCICFVPKYSDGNVDLGHQCRPFQIFQCTGNRSVDGVLLSADH